jgi:hypothetical protein
MSMVLLEASDIIMAAGVTKEQRALLLQHLVHNRLAMAFIACMNDKCGSGAFIRAIASF